MSSILSWLSFEKKKQPLSKTRLQSKKISRVMRAAAAMQIKEASTVFKRRHLTGVSMNGGAAVKARLPIGLTYGSMRNIDPWWHTDPVKRTFRDDELTPDRRIGKTDVYLVKTETRDIHLLDGREITTIRKVFYDKKKQLHFKELYGRDESGKIFDYNKIPKNLMQLDGISEVVIARDKVVVVTEGYPAAESLRGRGIQAVGVTSGTFNSPSERALDPLLGAGSIVLWPDNDSAGVTLMNHVAKKLNTMGAKRGQLKLLFWKSGPRKGDAFDFDGDDEELRLLIENSVEWKESMRIATNSIVKLSVPRTSPRLGLDRDVQPPTPVLSREFEENQSDYALVALAQKLSDGGSLSVEEDRLLKEIEHMSNGGNKDAD